MMHYDPQKFHLEGEYMKNTDFENYVSTLSNDAKDDILELYIGNNRLTGKISLKEFPNLKVIAVEPELSPVLSGGAPGPHPIQGIGAGFVPEVYKASLIDSVIQVSKDEAFDMARNIAKKEGIFVGISTGASLAAVAKANLPQNSKVLTFNYDTGERYLSVEGLY